MSAYAISKVEILDEAEGERCRQLAARSIRVSGERYLVGGALPEAAGGDWPPPQRFAEGVETP